MTEPDEAARAQRRQIAAHRRVFGLFMAAIALFGVWVWGEMYSGTPLARFFGLILTVLLFGAGLWNLLARSPGRFAARDDEDGPRSERWLWW